MASYKLNNQTVLITGASSGIGRACAEKFAELGANLVITARREERLNLLSEQLSNQFGIECLPLPLDVRQFNQVEKLFKDLKARGVIINILINNAGLALASNTLQEGKISDWETMIDTNIKGLLYMTKLALPSMIERNRGHIINIGSIAGHGCYATGNVYCATKHAVRAISKSLRLDLMGTSIRVSEVDPGAVNTEFSEVRWSNKERADKFYEGFQPLVAEDVADAVVYCATRPPHVNISELVLFPQAQASLTDLYRHESPPKDIFGIK